MRKGTNRKEFLHKLGVFSLAAGSSRFIPLPGSPFVNKDPVFELPELHSLPPTQLFSVLDLTLSEMASVRTALEEHGHEAALAALLEHYRNRFPKPAGIPRRSGTAAEQRTIKIADNMENHIFQRGPYPPADYGPDIDWGADPAGDIEWVAQINRFYWSRDLIGAYQTTGEERYVRTFVRLATDWIKKHPLEETVDKIHPIYDYWKGYVWLDIETGRRAHSICNAIRQLIHAD